MREKPTSRYMKPSCISITSTAATTTQVVSTATVRSLIWCFKGRPFASEGSHRECPGAPGRRHSPRVQDFSGVFVRLEGAYSPTVETRALVQLASSRGFTQKRLW